MKHHTFAVNVPVNKLSL